jgi:hypothetical protein
MDAMNSGELVSKVLPFLLSGMRGAKFPDGLEALDAAALTAQALRFMRPAPPDGLLVESEIVDGRRTASAFVGASLEALFGSGGLSHAEGVLAEAVVRAIGQAGARISPFDIPKLESFVSAHAEELGPEALAYVQRGEKRAAIVDYFAPEALNDENWTVASPSVRSRFLETRRRRDPDAARALLQAAWSSEPAEVRYRLLRSMATGLGSADAPFLASLSTDRSPRVKELAIRLRARLPRGRGGDASPSDAVSYIVKSTRGLLSRTTVLSLDIPLSSRRQDPSGWIRNTFSAVSIEEIVEAAGLPVDAVLRAASGDGNLVLALMYSAVASARIDLFETLCASFPAHAWDMLVRAEEGDLAGLEPEKRLRWLEALVLAETVGSFDQRAWRACGFVSSMEGLTSAKIVNRLVASPAGAKAVRDGRYGRDVYEALAVLAPPGARGMLRTALRDAGEDGRSSLIYLDILDNLENENG